MHFLRTVMIKAYCMEVRTFFLFPQSLILIMIPFFSLLLWILLTYWKERWLTIGLSLQVSTILSCSPVYFLTGLSSLRTPEQHIYDGFAFMACGHLLDPFGRRRYVLWVEPCLILPALALTSVLYWAEQAKHHCIVLKLIYLVTQACSLWSNSQPHMACPNILS